MLDLDSEWDKYIKNKQYGSATNYIVLGELQKFKISLPPIELQKQFVFEMEKEEEIIAANRRLIDLMEKKIEKVIAEV